MDIGVVIVTYNRLEKLKKCLASYEAQTLSPQYTIIVDNCSTDGSGAFLDEWARHTIMRNPIIIHNSNNSGGAGGFWRGLREASRLDAEWIWLTDDDAYPQPDCLEKIADTYAALEKRKQEETQAICGKIVDRHGISVVHRRRIGKYLGMIREIPLLPEEYETPIADIDIFSFVGTAVRRDTVNRVGLPYKEYFIFYDDTEYSLRIRKIGAIKCVGSAVILHDSPGDQIVRESWKNYYLFRNRMYTYKLYFNRYQCLMDKCKLVYMLFSMYFSKLSVSQFWRALRDAAEGKLGETSEYQP